MSFYNDNFIAPGGTFLINHTSDSGATYSPHPAFSPVPSAIEIAAGTRMRGNAATPNIFNISQAAPGPDHSMTCKVYVASTGSQENTGVLCRLNKTAATWYSLTVFNGAVQIYRAVNGVYTQLGLAVSIAESVGAFFNLTLTTLGTTITGTVTRDSDGAYLTSGGTWQATPANVFVFTDTMVLPSNYVGLYIGGQVDSDASGYQMASASGAAVPALGLTPMPVLDVKAGFGAQGLVRGSVADGSITSSGNILTSLSANFQSTDVGLDICVVSGNAMAPVFNAAISAAATPFPVPSTPTLGSQSGGSLPPTKYLVVITFETFTGEGGPSAENSTAFLVGQNNLLTVSAPASPGAGATGWNVYVAAQLQQPGAPSLNTSPTGGGLMANTTYRYKITAVDIHHPVDGSVAESAASNEAAAATGTGPNTYQITASWTAVPGAVAYNIYRTSGSPNTETFLTQVPGNVLSFTDTGTLTPGGAAAPTQDTGTGKGREVRQNPATLLFTQPQWIENSSGLSAGPGALVTKIKSVNSNSQVSLNYKWPFPVPATNLSVTWGIDDTAAIQSAYNAATSGAYGRSSVYFPGGRYMTTRKLTIGLTPGATNFVMGLVTAGAGRSTPEWSPNGFSAAVSASSMIVFAGHPSQPAFQLDGALQTVLRDLAIYGPAGSYSTTPALFGAPAAGILLRNSDPGSPTGGTLIENVSIGLCATALLMDNLLSNTGCADVTCHKVAIGDCASFGLRVLNSQGVDYDFRTVSVGSNPANPGFVAAQFDLGGNFRWEGGDVVSVGTILRILANGAGPGSANITLSDLRLEQNSGMQRIIIDTYNPTSMVHGADQTNTIVVENVTELPEGNDPAGNPLFYIGANTNLTVRSSTLYRAPLAKMSSAASPTTPPLLVSANDTTLLLDGVSYPNQVAFAAVITADPNCYWRSRNCRTNTQTPTMPGGTGTPRFDESTWIGDGVVTPFRTAFFSQFLLAGLFGGIAGYFRPGNRAQNKIANEFPYAQLVYGTCTRVFRNNPATSPPVLPGMAEDLNPGWFDGNSFITFLNGSYSTLFDVFSGPSTAIAFVRFPSSSFGRSNPIYSNLDTSAKTGLMLSISSSNLPTLQIGDGSSISNFSTPTAILADTWYMIAAVKDDIGNALTLYAFHPNGLEITPVLWHGYASSGKPRCIGQDNSVSPAQNAIGYIEMFGVIAVALTQAQLQNLYNVGINGG